jgi:hypothetical protein
MRKERLVYLWGNGGYFVLRQHVDGVLSVPEGQKAWETFARFAPRPLLLAALHSLHRGAHAE